ncbi:probable polyol transporter 3 isoform X1 [Drosophila mojavensis]|uniref:Major facilitator superfamily (MFS) profile domain-containing protein n=2 Tax=Drosophila mojavensis TaxID=7230 RepID=B4K5S1_DROMO|nr:probable polyol transporter 3 isoform X1 [Drosophila mojavensis]EDW15133.1 uncharacterized protein Dmoj_GI22944 [Drosophila mojavensis]
MATTYVISGPAPGVQPAFVATSAPQPQLTYIDVIEDPRTQRGYNRWTNGHNAHTATFGFLLFTYGGMDMAQGLQWNLGTGIANTAEIQFSWFIGVIIGAFVAGLVITHVPKKYFYLLGGVMMFIDGVIFVSAPFKYDPIRAARYVGGVGMGLITVAFIIHNSEVTLGNTRGKWCGMEQFGLSLGILIQVLMDSQWDYDSSININTAHGIMGIIFTVLATGTVAMSVESPIFYLRSNNEDEARNCQTQLLGTTVPTDIYEAIFAEAKGYVMESNSRSFGEELAASGMPFIKMLFSRCLVAFSFSYPLSAAMLNSTVVWKGSMHSWPIILWTILRFLGVLIAIAIVDKLGRKFISLVGLLCMAALMLALAGIFTHDPNFSSTYYMAEVSRVSLAFQIFAGIFVISTPTYLGEAFPMKVKPYLIGFVVCLEQLIHIIVIVTFGKTSDCFFQYFVGVGIILAVSLIIFAVLMPETRDLSLRQANERFCRYYDVMSY